MTNDFNRGGQDVPDGPSRDQVEIDLNFDTLRSFQAEFAPDLCRDGLFIKTAEPLPPSTVVRFRVLLPGEFVLVEGTAVVEWTREPGSIPGLPPGMALRFVTLGGTSQDTIDDIVDFHVAAGGLPFELEPSIGEPGEIPTDALAGSGSLVGDWQRMESGGEHGKVPRESYRLTVRGTGLPQEPEGPADLPSQEDSAIPEPDDVLPSWLRAQAEDRAPRLETDPAFAPPSAIGTSPEAASPGRTGDGTEEGEETAYAMRDEDNSDLFEAPETAKGSFDVTFPDDQDVADDTSVHPGAGPAAEVTVESEEGDRPEKRRKAWLALPAALVILAALGAAWWFVLGPGAGPVAKPPAAPVAVAPTPVAAEPTIGTVGPPTTPAAQPTSAAVAEPEQTIEQPAAEPTSRSNPATRVLRVAAETRDGETVVTIRGNGSFTDDAYRVSKLTDPERVLVRIRGIDSGYLPAEIEVGSPEVERIRIGHHPEEHPQSLYVVLDLTAASVVVRGSGARGEVLTLAVGPR